MSEFFQVLKRLVDGDDSVTSNDVIFSTRGEDIETTPAFVFWATVGTPKFDLFLEFWKVYPGGPKLRTPLANPNCYHFYGEKKKFQFPKAMDDIVAYARVMNFQEGVIMYIFKIFAGVFLKYAKEDDWSLFIEYKQRVYTAIYGERGAVLSGQQFSSIVLNFNFAWLGNPEQLKRLCTVDGTYGQFGLSQPEYLLGSKENEPNVHAPPEYTKIMISFLSADHAASRLQKVIRNLPSDLMVFDPRTGEKRAVESFTKLFDFYLESAKGNPELRPTLPNLKTEMVNKLAELGFTSDILKWIANSDSEDKIQQRLLRIKMRDTQLLIADPRIVSMIEIGSGPPQMETLTAMRRKNKIKVDSVIKVLMEKSMTPNMIDMIIQASMPWQVVWVGVDDDRKLGPKAEALSNYIRSKVVELNEKRYDEGPRKAARTKMLMVGRKFSEEQKEIVNNLRPLFSDSDSDFIEDEEVDKLLRYENVIMSYTDMIDDAVVDQRLTEMFQQRIIQAISRPDSINMKLLETAIHRIQVSEEPWWNQEDKDGKKVKERVKKAYLVAKDKLT